MAGRPKQGIDYAGWSVNIFDGDTKIDKLLDAQGWVGFSIYFYLCQMAYKFDGYFYRWGYDDAASTARRMGGGVSSGTVSEAVTYCLQIGLFDKRTFDGWGVLTSKGIQRRFCAATQGRRVKSVIKNYWLLKEEESKGLEMCAADEDLQPANEHLQEANSDLQSADDPKSKVKQSKGKESNNSIPDGIDCRADIRRVVEAWNSVGLEQVTKLLPDTERYKMLKTRIKQYGIDEVLRAIENVRQSDFLQGKSGNKPFYATFEWVMRPNNFPKVLEGKYMNRPGDPKRATTNDDYDLYKALGVDISGLS